MVILRKTRQGNTLRPYVVPLELRNGLMILSFCKNKPKQPLQGEVDAGFYDIFDSMTYQPITTGSATRLANGIAKTLNGAKVTVIGHSLGSALAAYLSAELTALCGADTISACLFACPKPGNEKFSHYFTQLGMHYTLFNYTEDIVPRMPPLGYSALENVTLLEPGGLDQNILIASNAPCCHHLMSYIALLDTQIFTETLALPGTNADDQDCSQCVTLNPVGLKKAM
jgi:pimeloyl-ACP methyl ester carboxylesterase